MAIPRMFAVPCLCSYPTSIRAMVGSTVPCAIWEPIHLSRRCLLDHGLNVQTHSRAAVAEDNTVFAELTYIGECFAYFVKPPLGHK
jgi:hypothetical protein